MWKPDGELCPESGVSAGFGCWLSYEDNGDLKSRSEIFNGEIVYELPDDYKDWEDDEDDEDDGTDELLMSTHRCLICQVCILVTPRLIPWVA